LSKRGKTEFGQSFKNSIETELSEFKKKKDKKKALKK
jgi:hypothetical protein